MASATTKKTAFTLIELLVVIAIIAILAAILFPVFAQAKAASQKTVALSNKKQIGLAGMLYMADFDDTMFLHNYYQDNNTRWHLWFYGFDMVLNRGRADYGLLWPYQKNVELQDDPMARSIRTNATWANPTFWPAYGINAAYLLNGLSPSATVPLIPAVMTSVERPAETILLTDVAGFNATTGAFFRVNTVTPPSGIDRGVQGGSFASQFGNTHFRHSGETVTVLWVDGHVSTMKPTYKQGAAHASRRNAKIGHLSRGPIPDTIPVGDPNTLRYDYYFALQKVD
ncbi:MAG: prepilin-type N-terminal cleavage/methylation domain-containing protein [Fimbriimonadaceae bacterium]|jgi:prepilin-type N-terminal cleavage/methylation domain-containing protein/prepilin-type processing-associated H-X9-DG protein|nr:prepilin-type N-terminal cleavage/methylation domain-containing protein [Fimbriimonadaceae bacterium]